MVISKMMMIKQSVASVLLHQRSGDNKQDDDDKVERCKRAASPIQLAERSKRAA